MVATYEMKLESFREAQALDECAEKLARFCQSGPNKGKPGPCPKQGGSTAKSSPKSQAKSKVTSTIHPKVKAAHAAVAKAKQRLAAARQKHATAKQALAAAKQKHQPKSSVSTPSTPSLAAQRHASRVKSVFQRTFEPGGVSGADIDHAVTTLEPLDVSDLQHVAREIGVKKIHKSKKNLLAGIRSQLEKADRISESVAT